MGSNKILMKGNIALCEGAIAAGCDAYFGYPITPQNEVPAYMSGKMVQLDRVFVQAESEISAINMVFGAAVCGKRAMTSSSSPGISLKQEGISYLCACELPCLIVNVQRGGPGLGNIAGSQADYFQATKGGGHGDYRMIVLAPYSVREMYEFANISFQLSEKYRNPVMILTDGIIGQMMEPVSIEDNKREPITRSSTDGWCLGGCLGREPRSIKSLFMTEGVLEKHNYHLKNKYDLIKKNEVRYEEYLTEDAAIVVIAYGISARIAKSAVRKLREDGIKAGFIRPITLWPFPYDKISEVSSCVKKILVAEMNLGQMVEDVRLAVNGKCPVEFIGHPGGGLFTDTEIKEKLASMF
ncbi:MAG: 2-oxoglutarate oxidoreductase subunit KorA [Elusimicrobia bacterium ADurb.Bin231]|nr:MAG: 2-oxoglutarate oxidoreductase subunit KorA [Elusimicrobia bacterium ADurb.Bin231]